jgi:hypothetical protein
MKGTVMPSKTKVPAPGRQARTLTRAAGARRPLDLWRSLAASWLGIAPFQRQLLNGLQDGRPIYGGTVSDKTIAKRRARNKAARRSRRVNRIAAHR